MVVIDIQICCLADLTVTRTGTHLARKSRQKDKKEQVSVSLLGSDGTHSLEFKVWSGLKFLKRNAIILRRSWMLWNLTVSICTHFFHTSALRLRLRKARAQSSSHLKGLVFSKGAFALQSTCRLTWSLDKSRRSVWQCVLFAQLLGSLVFVWLHSVFIHVWIIWPAFYAAEIINTVGRHFL